MLTLTQNDLKFLRIIDTLQKTIARTGQPIELTHHHYHSDDRFLFNSLIEVSLNNWNILIRIDYSQLEEAQSICETQINKLLATL